MNPINLPITKDEYLNGRCEVCGFYTFKNAERGSFALCNVCLWEDDGFNEKPNDARGGPNQELTLNQARVNFMQFSAYSKHVNQYARKPLEDELSP